MENNIFLGDFEAEQDIINHQQYIAKKWSKWNNNMRNESRAMPAKERDDNLYSDGKGVRHAIAKIEPKNISWTP